MSHPGLLYASLGLSAVALLEAVGTGAAYCLFCQNNGIYKATGWSSNSKYSELYAMAIQCFIQSTYVIFPDVLLSYNIYDG